MQIQAKTLYLLDGNKIVGINDPGQQANVPLVFFGRTRNSIFTYFRTDLPQSLKDEIDQQIRTDLNIIALCNILRTYKQLKRIWMGPAYMVPKLPSFMNQDICIITESNRHYLNRYFNDVNEQYEHKSPIIAFIDNGHAVSVCCSARKSNQAIEASLFTLEQHRGKGIAPNLVAIWSMQVRNLGYIPLYSTSWDNLHSQRVAQKLGLIQYGIDVNITGE
ncbi:GNAT family N-acetyltransferase [Paenibacillus arenosi]|uniref:GNAT family N-acetyltransferase n=1 Tax=Paenibacillus arenosi TaxID=2774142 RepID=A0ABR9AT18_9BACL|nr:GNAT family N-acetyltransferase [Paenibacillus arenosi]MBD8497267.1 GNAT family N-acetyltransferase [Paenibacillus arenosi]